MKKLRLFFLIGLIIFIASCGDEEENNNNIVTYNSECLYMKDGSTDDYSAINFQYYAQEKKLVFKHINTAFNCCPGALSASYLYEGNTIRITESEKEALCSCLCLYNLEMAINNISLGTYDITVNEPYLTDEPNLQFQINLNDSTQGTYKVPRENYPWNLSGLE